MGFIILVTSSNPKQARYCLKELQLRQQMGLIEKDTMVLAVPDPQGARIGSGGGTINAILFAAQWISNQKGLETIDVNALEGHTLLIIHSGGDSQRCPTLSVCGKAWSFFPSLSKVNSLISNVDLLINTFHEIVKPGTQGVFVFCGDVLVKFDRSYNYKWRDDGITGLSLPVMKKKGPEHGVYHIDNKTGELLGYYQKASLKTLEDVGAVSKKTYNNVIQDCVLLDTGVIYIPPKICNKLLTLFMQPPLCNSTFIGVEQGNVALRLELYSDILNAIGGNLETHNEDNYMRLSSETSNPTLPQARRILWDTLKYIPFYCNSPETGSFFHTGTTKEFIDLLHNSICREEHSFQYRILCKVPYLVPNMNISPNCTIMNSTIDNTNTIIVGEKSLIEHSTLHGDINVGSSCWVSGVKNLPYLTIPDNLCIQEIPIKCENDKNLKCIFILFGINDNIKGNYKDSSSTFCNIPWKRFCEKYDIATDDIWKNIPENKWNIWNAKLFPIHHEESDIRKCMWFTHEKVDADIIKEWKNMNRLSMKEILMNANSFYESEFRWGLMKKLGSK